MTGTIAPAVAADHSTDGNVDAANADANDNNADGTAARAQAVDGGADGSVANDDTAAARPEPLQDVDNADDVTYTV